MRPHRKRFHFDFITFGRSSIVYAFVHTFKMILPNLSNENDVFFLSKELLFCLRELFHESWNTNQWLLFKLNRIRAKLISSSYLFNLCIKVMELKIRQNNNINGKEQKNTSFCIGSKIGSNKRLCDDTDFIKTKQPFTSLGYLHRKIIDIEHLNFK